MNDEPLRASELARDLARLRWEKMDAEKRKAHGQMLTEARQRAKERRLARKMRQ